MQGTASPQYSMCFGKERQPSGWHPKASFPERGKGTGGGSQTGRSLQWGKDWRENLLRFSLRPKWSFWTFTLSRQNLKFCLGALFFRIPNRSFVGLCPTTPVAFLKKATQKTLLTPLLPPWAHRSRIPAGKPPPQWRRTHRPSRKNRRSNRRQCPAR